MRKRSRYAVLALLLLGGCAQMMPNTAAAIAPATIPDMMTGIGADIEQWITTLMLLLGV